MLPSMPQDDHGPGDPDAGGDGPDRKVGPADVLGHAQLLRQGERGAAALTRLGVRDGDPVAVLLPMCLESVIVTLACLRIGALRITLPVGDYLGFVRNRIRISGARVVISADNCQTDGVVQDVKAGLDRALWGCPEVHTVLVVPQLARPVPWVPGRDLWWHETLATRPAPHSYRPYAGGMSSLPPPDREKPDPLAAFDFDDPLDRRSADDTDQGWGERHPDDPDYGGGSSGGAADLARFLNERPPHHI
jgi:acyl-CoA synthetase (AMP-forming)/AMP-acid ligase II